MTPTILVVASASLLSVILLIVAVIQQEAIHRLRLVHRQIASRSSDQQREIMQLQEDVVRLRGRVNALLDAIPDPVLLLDGNSICLASNHSARLLFGPSEGRKIIEITQSAELKSILRTVSQQPDQGSHGREILIQHPANMAVSVTVARLGPSDDIAVILQDRTELRRLETIRKDFVANVSHELRTPLTSVKAMAETLLDGALHDPSVARRFLETIVTDTDRLVRLSSDLLNLSRVESHELERELVDVVALTRDITSRLRSSIKASGLTLDVSMPPESLVLGSEDEIGQVLLNLLENAIKYSLDGGKISVAISEATDTITVSVADTGIGILQQDIPRIFERFYRADKARTRTSGGTGLGLSIVKHIVERHGGRVWVDSVYNHGSCFYFSLPLAPEMSDSAELTALSA